VDTSKAKYADFAIVVDSVCGLGALTGLLAELRDEYPETLHAVELLGDPGSGQSVVMLRFGCESSSLLRSRIQFASSRIKGRRVDPARMSPIDRDGFYSKWLTAFPIRLDAQGDPEHSAEKFCEQMGLVRRTDIARVDCEFSSEGALWRIYSQILAEGEIFVASRAPPTIGSEVRLQLAAGEMRPPALVAQVLWIEVAENRSGFQAKVTASAPFKEFFRHRAAEKRQGRRSRRQGGKRKHERFVVKWDAAFENLPDLPVEHTTNVGVGGAFVKTFIPPAVGTRIDLSLRLPSGERLVTEAEVVHVVTVAQAAGQTYPPGVNLRFVRCDSEFRTRITQLIAEYERKPPRVLVVDDDDDFRDALAEGLIASGMAVEKAGTGQEALQKLIEQLFDLDVVLLDIRMPGLDGRGFLNRVRNLGGELDLRIIVLSAAPRAELERLRGPAGANEVMSKSDSLSQIVARIREVLDRPSNPAA
jgi:uncharacterized protein (TIGR02266 family)